MQLVYTQISQFNHISLKCTSLLKNNLHDYYSHNHHTQWKTMS